MECVGMEKFPRWSPGRLNAGPKVGIMLTFNFPRCEHFLWPGWGDLSHSEIVVRDTYDHLWALQLPPLWDIASMQLFKESTSKESPPPFMKDVCMLPYLHDPACGLYPEPAESSPHLFL
jgi:hypothetical protein